MEGWHANNEIMEAQLRSMQNNFVGPFLREVGWYINDKLVEAQPEAIVSI